MSPTVIALVVFICTLGGALLGMRLRTTLPEHHLDADSKDTVKLGVGLVATMTALVLGLVTASAKSSFDEVDTAVRHTAIDILALDRVLARYGSETREIREALKRLMGDRIDSIWPEGPRKPALPAPLGAAAVSGAEGLADAVRDLTPRDASQRALQSRAMDAVEALLKVRWLVVAGAGASVPLPFLGVLLFWLTFTFGSFGLFAPWNTTVVTVLFICALSVSSAVFLVLEMDGPFEGVLKVSASPLRYAHSRLNE